MTQRAPKPTAFLLSFLSIPILLLSACHFVRSNPNDVAGTDYVGVSILRPGDNALITVDTVVVTWQGQGDIAVYNYRFDNGAWTSAGTQTSVVLRRLEEGTHFLEVRATNTKHKDSTTAVNFIVNALAGPSICVAPQLTVCSAADTAVTVSINLEEVNQVLGVNAVLWFDHTKIAFKRSSSAWKLFADTLGPDTLELSAACLDSVSGFSGSGKLADLTFRPVSVSTAADIVFLAGRSKMTAIGGSVSPFRNLRKGSISR
jgi:hypothetical protein